MSEIADRVVEVARLGPEDMLVVHMPPETEPDEAALFRQELITALGCEPQRVALVFGVESLTVLAGSSDQHPDLGQSGDNATSATGGD